MKEASAYPYLRKRNASVAVVVVTSLGLFALSNRFTTRSENVATTTTTGETRLNDGDNNKSKSDITSGRLIFLGTGSSTGCPRPACPLLFSPAVESNTAVELLRQDLQSLCRVSNLAMEGGDPRSNKNYRNNPSMVISLTSSASSSTVDQGDYKEKPGPPLAATTNIIIDVGKTFREGALRWLPTYGIATLDAIVLTHQHMDAAGGLDDVRGFQHWMQHATNTLSAPRQIPMPLFISQLCLDDLQERFPWLLPKKKKTPRSLTSEDVVPEKNDKPVVVRHVASFDVTVFKSYQPVNVKGLTIIPLPVMHGEDLISFGFAFTVGTTNIVYLSDISRMLPETLDFIQTKLPPTDILVLDSLHPETPNPVHYSFKDAIQLVKEINPKQVYLVGINCDSFLPHDEMNAKLQREYGNIQLAHDGLVLDV